MPDISIIKLKIRRGTDAQRKLVLLEQGELGYTTDTNRVFVGDGVTTGGNTIGTKLYTPITNQNQLTAIPAFLGDAVYAGTLLYQLTASDYTSLSSWGLIELTPDNSTLEYTGTPNRYLQIKNNGITGTKFNSSAGYSQGGIIATVANGLSANVDSRYIVLSSNYITLSAIDQNKIKTASFGNGIVGGDGVKITVNADPTYFGYNSGILTLTAMPAGIVNFASLSSGIFGAGLTVGANVQTVLQSVDNTSITNTAGVISVTDVVGGGITNFQNVIYNSKGQIYGTTYTVSDTFSGKTSTISNLNNIFFGAPDQISSDAIKTSHTIIDAASGNGTTTQNIQLSSAGFLAFVNTGSDLGTTVDRFAIPIFTY
jgi:hypothetical protein